MKRFDLMHDSGEIEELEDGRFVRYADVARLDVALEKINGIRNSIVGGQLFNWSEHAYPLVAALEEAGIKGDGHEIASKNLGTLLDQVKAAEAQRDELAKEAEKYLANIEQRQRELSEVTYQLRLSRKAVSEIEFQARLNRELLTNISYRLDCSGNHGDILTTLGVLVDERDALVAALKTIKNARLRFPDGREVRDFDAIDRAVDAAFKKTGEP